MRYLHYSVQQTAICLPNWGGGGRPNLGATRPRVGIANLGFDAPKLAIPKVLIFMYLLVKASSLD